MSWDTKRHLPVLLTPHPVCIVVSHISLLMSFWLYIFIDSTLYHDVCQMSSATKNLPTKTRTKQKFIIIFQAAVVATDHFDFLKASQLTNLWYVLKSIDRKREREREIERDGERKMATCKRYAISIYGNLNSNDPCDCRTNHLRFFRSIFCLPTFHALVFIACQTN